MHIFHLLTIRACTVRALRGETSLLAGVVNAAQSMKCVELAQNLKYWTGFGFFHF